MRNRLNAKVTLVTYIPSQFFFVCLLTMFVAAPSVIAPGVSEECEVDGSNK